MEDNAPDDFTQTPLATAESPSVSAKSSKSSRPSQLGIMSVLRILLSLALFHGFIALLRVKTSLAAKYGVPVFLCLFAFISVTAYSFEIGDISDRQPAAVINWSLFGAVGALFYIVFWSAMWWGDVFLCLLWAGIIPPVAVIFGVIFQV